MVSNVTSVKIGAAPRESVTAFELVIPVVEQVVEAIIFMRVNGLCLILAITLSSVADITVWNIYCRPKVASRKFQWRC